MKASSLDCVQPMCFEGVTTHKPWQLRLSAIDLFFFFNKKSELGQGHKGTAAE